MSREFDLLDTIRLWDSLFADTQRHDFMTYLCCAMVLEQREALIIGDFSDNLRLVRAGGGSQRMTISSSAASIHFIPC